MVLIRPAICALAALALVGLAGCNESLFGTRPGGKPGPGSGSGSADASPDVPVVPGLCTAPCVADAGAEYDGTTGGKGGHWRYLDDSRSPQRTWSPMMVSGQDMVGADGNRITSCAAHPDALACATLPGALLMSSAGATAATDPAIEFKAPTGEGLTLRLQALLPAGDAQTIRLYRNSREDVLFTADATAGIPVSHEITLDALPGDRFLVAVAPTGNGATDVGVQLTISTAPRPFPTDCHFAFRFDSLPTGDSDADITCLQGGLQHDRSGGLLTPLSLGPGPFTLLGTSAIIGTGTYLAGFPMNKAVDYSHDVTIQLWTKLASFVAAGPASIYSDLDATGGGINVQVLPGPPETVVVSTRTAASDIVTVSGSYPRSVDWHFLRVVRSATNLRVCVDGALVKSMDESSLLAAANQLPTLGKDFQAATDQASFDGNFDDVRAINSALPCE
ncbi:MAG TPA: LamG-like jellyroll fold domain-containing protein [Kofleriaceae bacterium]|nr:LamG-like jellyroll fold domain-containing protein [Kofleriaceae bacterium]